MTFAEKEKAMFLRVIILFGALVCKLDPLKCSIVLGIVIVVEVLLLIYSNVTQVIKVITYAMNL